MDIKQTFITKNPCYQSGRKIKPKGIMVHSTATPGVMAGSWFDRWNNEKTGVAVHAFLDDKEVYQHLPWEMRAWHCGGSGNDTHISFEICEPLDMVFVTRPILSLGRYCPSHAVKAVQELLSRLGLHTSAIDGDYGPLTQLSVMAYQKKEKLTPDGVIGPVTWGRLSEEPNSPCRYLPEANKEYFDKAYQNAVDLCVYLCKLYNLTEKDIICHYEGHQKGIASGHEDVLHWFPLHGKSMNDFRSDVRAKLRAKFVGDSEPQDWSRSAIYWMISRGILKGNEKGDLMLRSSCTRESTAVFLHRYARLVNLLHADRHAALPKLSAKGDNQPSSWAVDAVGWALSVGLLTGDDKGDLMLQSPCTREMMTVFLYRLAKEAKLDTSAKSVALSTNGVDSQPAPWAAKAVKWAISSKILFGDADNNLMLRRDCTREMMAVFLYRFHRNVFEISPKAAFLYP